MPEQIPVPEGQVARRKLHFFWLTDYSGSMSGKKIATLNQAIREALPEIKKTAVNHPEVEIVMRAIKFSDNASWHVGPQTVPIEQFVWPELSSAGSTATAKAIRLLASELTVEKMPPRGVPPVCILVSDGFCTDPPQEYDGSLSDLSKLPWGKKSVRLAIAIGDESEYDEEELLKFVSHKEIGVLKAHTVQQLINYIKWASTTAVAASSQSKSKDKAAQDANVILPTPPQPRADSNPDVF
jgi:uncharacterized protein YegL